MNPFWPLAYSHFLAAAFITDLGHEDFATREQASAALRKMLPASLPQLWQARRDGKSLERARRAEHILGRFLAERRLYLAKNTLPGKYPVLPWIDPFGVLADFEAGHYLTRAQESGKVFALYDDWRYATRLWLYDFYAGANADQGAAVKLLDKMVEVELSWRAANPRAALPPLKTPPEP